VPDVDITPPPYIQALIYMHVCMYVIIFFFIYEPKKRADSLGLAFQRNEIKERKEQNAWVCVGGLVSFWVTHKKKN